MSSSSSQQRLLSLDAFRGATIAGMIMVNNPGTWSDIYPQLRHAAWDGWTFTDFIFPFFLWIVGVAMTLSFAKRVEQGANKPQLLLHVFRRAVIIFGLGIFLTGFPFGLLFGHQFSLGNIRIPGVLQRIAICYLIASAIFSLDLAARADCMDRRTPCGVLAHGETHPRAGLWCGRDATAGRSLLVGGLDCFGGAHLAGAPVMAFDPEGIVSTIPAIATTLFGVMMGHWLRTKRSVEEKTVWMFVAGEFLMLIGAVLDMWFPINKNLWSSSYVIFMAGWASVIFAMFYWLIDVKGYKKWALPFNIMV